ncbi:toxin-antitoxin system HicB family antitoxin [Plantactinospora sp. ZYX-F-223]|uniref:toxin-antitoxin system HicB family antitoxin n=1 Tax=Plantactinospora sp. ZYX-F-223 TaxID=3144103 RepID=UPI0031FE2ADB
MDLAPYLAALRRDLAAAAAPGGPEISRAAELLAGSLDISARLCLLEVLADATAEITAKLDGPTVEVRLRAREADLVVHRETPEQQPATAAPGPPPAPPPPTEPPGDVARITLRLPDTLKDAVERAATAEGISVNAWLVRAVAAAVPGAAPPPTGRAGRGSSRRITGWAQA